MSDIHIACDYPHSPAKVWRAVTDPALIPLWTATGAGARAEGFTATVGTRFQFVAKPKPGWSGVVDCEVLAVDEPSLLRYSWTDAGGGDVTEVVYHLEPHAGGTRFTYEHTGFSGVGGAFTAKFLGRVRRKMLTVGLPAVLDDLDDNGALRPAGTLTPKALG
ncbi:MAG: SRPBCC family protein [Actinoallomurus sp.]